MANKGIVPGFQYDLFISYAHANNQYGWITEFQEDLSNLLWERMVSVGVLCGALMLLWAKALSLEESGSPYAVEEWNWWVTQLRHRT